MVSTMFAFKVEHTFIVLSVIYGYVIKQGKHGFIQIMFHAKYKSSLLLYM